MSTRGTDACQPITATIEGEEIELHFVHVIDAFSEAGKIVIELAAVSIIDQRTAHGRLRVGDLLDEAIWIWTE